ncbi:MAG TPA: OPT/YSL family transporter [Vicinamibacteria bacterium]|nr:OPT/YSL family transporter [Vicinamibacteria bacterium]
MPSSEKRRSHPSIFEPSNLVLGVLFAVLGTVIGLELLTRVGITPNSSIIAAIFTIGLSRIPLSVFTHFRDLGRQNLMQTVISAATFGGANGILLPVGVLWLLGRVDLLPAMMVGAVAGVVIDATILFRLFGTRLFPAEGLWPSGVATAECLIAGDRGGKRAALLAAGGTLGALGHPFGIPMDVFGVCWIGNIWALLMFGLGLIVRGYAHPVAGIDIEEGYVPHGFMIGAGLVAVVQIGVAVLRERMPSAAAGAPGIGRTLIQGYGAYCLAASVMAAIAGLTTEMSTLMLAGFVLFAATAAIVSELIVGIAAMHSGWFPAFATALIFLLIGMALGFPPLPLAFLVGFTASTGPAFADMGYDLKAGFILRGRGADPEYEREGRRAQFEAELLGIAVAALAVLFFHASYFERDLFPPWDRVAAATIEAGASPSLAKALLLWAVPGALLQALGGPARQLGVLFATGLLIRFPAAGWTAMISLAVRFFLTRRYGERAESPMYVLAGGFIAGSALTSFGVATLKLK